MELKSVEVIDKGRQQEFVWHEMINGKEYVSDIILCNLILTLDIDIFTSAIQEVYRMFLEFREKLKLKGE